MGLEADAASLASYPAAVEAVAGRDDLSFSEASRTLRLEAVELEGREGRRASQVASRAVTVEAVEGREGIPASQVTSPSDSEGVEGLRPERPLVLGSVGVRTALRGVVQS